MNLPHIDDFKDYDTSGIDRRSGPIIRQSRTDNYKVVAWGGVHYIRGNIAPHFSLTMGSWDIARNGRLTESIFGAAHEELLKHWPELVPLAALHLSDWDGTPMHAEANGFYYIAGYGGGLGERFHAGNQTRYGDDKDRDPRELSLESWARHVRLPVELAKISADSILASSNPRGAHAIWIEGQKRHWAQQAKDCCEKLEIRFYYGDKFPGETT